MSERPKETPPGSPRRQLRELLRLLYRNTGEIFATGPVQLYIARYSNGGAYWVSDNIRALTGFEESMFTSSYDFWTSRLHPDDRRSAVDAITGLARGETVTIEYRWLARDDTYRWFLDQFVRIDTPDEPLLVGAVIDVTESHEKAEELIAANQRLDAVFEASPYAIIAIDSHERVQLWNDAATRMFGWSPEEAIGEKLPTIPEELRAEADELRRRANGGERVTNFVTRRRRKDGSVFDVSLSAAPLFDRHGLPAGTMGMLVDITEQKEKDDALRFQASLLGAVNQAIIVSDPDGRIVYWNRYAGELFGWTAGEALGRDVVELTVPEISTQQAAGIMDALRRGASWRGEFTVRHRSGRPVPLLVSDSPILDDEGRLTAIVGVSVDLSEQQAADEALRRSEERFRALFEQSPIATFLFRAVDRDFELIDFNPAARELTATVPPPYLGMRASERYAEYPAALEDMRATDETGYPRERALEYVLPDGRKRAIFVNFARVDRGLLMLHVRDLTEQKATEQALRFSNQALSALFQASPVAIIALDRERNVQAWNAEAERMYGWRAEEVNGRPIPFLTREQTHGPDSLISKVLGGEGVTNFELSRPRRDGSEVVVSLSASPLFDSEGRISGLVSAAVDITSRKAIEDELRARAAQESAVAEIAELALQGSDLERLMNRSCEVVANALDVRFSWIEVPLPDGRLEIRAGTGWRKKGVGRSRTSGGMESQGGVTLNAGTPIVSEDVMNDPRLRPSPIHERYRIVSAMSAVIPGRERPFGVIEANDTAKRFFAEHDVNFLVAAAGVLGTAIEHLQSQEALADREATLRLLIQQIPAVVFTTDLEMRLTSSIGLGMPGGSSPFASIGRRLGEIAGDNPQAGAAIEAQTRAFRGDPTRYEVLWRGRALEVHVEPFRTQSGEITGSVGVAVDITERKQHEAELQESRERLQALSTRVLTIQEDERTSIAREVHDELGQALTALKLNVALVEQNLKNGKIRELGERCSEMHGIIDETIESVRRIASQLNPPLLEHLGLAAAIEEEARRFERRSGIATRVRMPEGTLELDRHRSTAIFRMVQEALTNVARHARATSVELTLSETDGRLRIEIEDNGRGITDDERLASSSLGLIGMRERIRSLEGELQIEGRHDAGTKIIATIPARPADAGQRRDHSGPDR
ncbi:MAG: PAS domain S-box protein [Thermoanaerobaculia bacterium]